MRNLALIAIALIIAAVTAYAIKQRIEGAGDGVPELPANVQNVLVAAETITAGTFIRSEKHFTWRALPENEIKPEYLIQGARDPQEFNGAVARKILPANEPVTETALVKPDDGGFLQAVLGEGMRAVSIAVNETSGNAGFIFPGDRVDLILTHSVKYGMDENTGRNDSGYASETFISNVRVLAVDQRFKNNDNQVLLARTVTLEVSPKQAEMINVASELGRLSLSLRSLQGQGANGDSQNMTRDSDVSPLLRATRGDSFKPYKVNVSRGTARQAMEFNKGEK